MDRFERQILLPGFGKEGQEKLSRSSVLLIGAGGLGCPILLYLAAAGIGKIGLVDGDVVSVSNLNRQVIYGEKDLGRKKVEVAAGHIQGKYRDLSIDQFAEFITPQNALKIIGDYDLVIDGSDNFATRYLVNDACVLLGKPLVFGAIYQYEGQVSVFNHRENSVNYRDLFPEPPALGEVPNCAETGVLGVLPGTIGTLMAAEAIKVISGLGKVLSGRVLFFNSLSAQSFEVSISPNPDARKQMPASKEEFENLDYEFMCEGVREKDWEQALSQLSEEAVLVDVREEGEFPLLEDFSHVKLPLSEIQKGLGLSGRKKEAWLFCQSGVRSKKAALLLQGLEPTLKIYSVRGGILAFPSSKKE
ncbi:HesA/MoeB/ThiF family protein [Algoriphagus sp. CAU 1675]|uniref:HesA/MoeB/ThiF family protein n=1 Tax=Algoriphagus sp. CAU 1675 TaxID=3032597 RepID=UPI0023DA709E|nr:HesA/MoeB/ThiF family protein [Algoriphagus sp. CAU 1675]MDF2158315.1 HesA/MoeB/ThiF family protein [Algoriphagus sp. CAU 1675]